MSFALNVKKNIVLRENMTPLEIKALLSGFIKYNGELIFLNQHIGLKLSSISNTIIRKLYTDIRTVYKGKIEVSISQSKILKQNKVYTIFLTDDVKEMLGELEIFDWDINQKNFKMPTAAITNETLFWSYVSGIFISCGSANDPETSNYHLELQLKDEESSSYFIEQLNQRKFNFKKILKRGKWVCYIKKSNEVSDFLVRVNATSSALEFEATRAGRELKNQVNRYLNIELHNSQISIETAERQVKMINMIKQQGRFLELSPKARLLADLRVQNPASSFNELVELMEENGIDISKPGINYLFRNIKKIYESL